MILIAVTGRTMFRAGEVVTVLALLLAPAVSQHCPKRLRRRLPTTPSRPHSRNVPATSDKTPNGAILRVSSDVTDLRVSTSAGARQSVQLVRRPIHKNALVAALMYPHGTSITSMHASEATEQHEVPDLARSARSSYGQRHASFRRERGRRRCCLSAHSAGAVLLAHSPLAR